jgi:hypothetical protein
MAHMTSFCGSETIPAIRAVEEYYNANSANELIAATVPATEHSVACACSCSVDVDQVILDDNDKIIGYIDSKGNKYDL